jgi:ABC-type branched-subunit amino acid transport system ATPase component
VTLISSNVGQGGVDNWYGVIAGIGVILTVIFNPEGLVGPTHLFLEQRRTRGALARPDGTLAGTGASAGSAPSAPLVRRAPETHVSVAASDGAETGIPAGGGAAAESRPAQRRASPEAVPLLQVRDLTVRYGGVVAVDSVSLSVEEGQIVGLIGPNGAGKTTAIDALCGFHGYEGGVLLAGADVGGSAPHRRASLGMARTFQLAGVSDDLTVAENVQVGQHRATARDPETLTRIMGELGLVGMRDLLVANLSQGQRQLVSIARALAGEPRLLLLDEPAAGLDSTESLWLADRLRDVRASGVTILLVDHDMSLVLNLCDTIAVLDFGALIASGPPEDIRTDERVSTAYLGATHQRLVAS